MKKPSTYTRWIGRESAVCFIPTSSISGGSLAPIENSPPGTHTIPSGAFADGFASFSTVGSNVAAAAFVSTGLVLGAGPLLSSHEKAKPPTRTVTKIGAIRFICRLL